MTTPRREPYARVTWLTPVLSDDAKCAWAPWFKTRHQFTRTAEDNFNLDKWKAQHGQMVDALAALLRENGWTVYLEGQNEFKLKVAGVILAGTPDIVALLNEEIRVFDCKTGKRRASDRWQVLVYMLCLRHYHPAAKGTTRTIHGVVSYRDGDVEIRAEQLTPKVRQRINDHIARAGAATPPDRVPSARECSYCEIGPSDCSSRMEREAEPEPAAVDAL